MSTILQISNIVDAKNIIGTELRKAGLEIFGKSGHQKLGMYSHFYFIEVKTGRKHWIKFDKENFLSLGKQFRELNTIGETIDKDVIDGLKDDDIVYFAKPDRIYFISVKTIREQSRNRINDTDLATTLSFPIKLLTRFDESTIPLITSGVSGN